MRDMVVSLIGNDFFTKYSISDLLSSLGFKVLQFDGAFDTTIHSDFIVVISNDTSNIDSLIDNISQPCLVIGDIDNSYFMNDLIIDILPISIPQELFISKVKIIGRLIKSSLKSDAKSRLLEKKIIDLQEKVARVESASKTKSFFLANVSHEIKTPLTGIKGFAEMMMDTGLNSDQREYMNYVNLSVKRLNNIVSDVLDYTELETIGYKESERSFYVGDTIENAVSFVEIDAIHKNLTIETQISDNIPFCISGDESRLRQILVLLMNNAIKFTAKGSIRVDAEMIGSEKDGVMLSFSVSDTGIGIKKEKIPFIFDRFYQIDDSHNRKYGGLGLGLAIVKQLIDNMQGEIWVESEENIGTAFKFVLPFRVTNSTNEVGHKDVSPIGKKLLIVEDNPINMKIFRLILEKMGYELSVAENGIHALQAYENERFDLIFMDVQMPELNGLEATIRIREKEKNSNIHTPIVAFTAHSTSRDKDACMKAGMDDVLNKPIQKTALQNVLNKFIN